MPDQEANRDECILILAPVGRDGELLRQVISANGLESSLCHDVPSLCEAIRTGVGAVILTEEALYLPDHRQLSALVEAQPDWSDLPFVVLTTRGDADEQIQYTIELMRPLRNVTVLERPARPATIVSALEAALRDRRRQYAVRQTLDELQQSQSELRISEQRYRTLADAVPQLVWSCLPSGECDYLSAQWVDYTGVPEEDQLGYAWLDVLHPEDKERAFASWRAAIEGRGVYDLDYRIRRRDGTYRWFRVRGTPQRNASGGITRWFGTCTDIHERKLAEEALELANSVGATLAADLDLDRIVAALTDASTKATGAEFGAFFYNVTNENGESYMLYSIAGVPREAFSKFPMPRKTEVFAPTFDGVGVVRSENIMEDSRYGKVGPHFGMPEGHLPVKSYLAIPVISRSGEVIGGLFFGHSEVGVFTEAHERVVSSFASQAAVAMDNARLYSRLKNLNLDLEKRVDERTHSLQAAIRELEGFTYSVSHDLRSPLRGMIANARFLLEDYSDVLPPEGLEQLQAIDSSARRMAQLINDLLNFARLGNKPIQKQEVDISSLARIVAEPLLEADSSVLQLEIQPGLSGYADPELIKLVIQNLLENSFKYRSKDGPVKVQFGAEQNGSGPAFYVRDNGIGFSNDYSDKLFRAFERLHRDTDYPGTGIGLANVKRIIERHGGHVWADGKPGEGATFYFTLG